MASAPRDSSPVSNIPSQATTAHGASTSPQNQEVEAFDEFDPRGSISGRQSNINMFFFCSSLNCSLNCHNVILKRRIWISVFSLNDLII